MMPAHAVGELVSAPFEFTCIAKHHHHIDEVRLASMREVSDRRYREGVRVDLEWWGYCARCGRRVPVEPLPRAVAA